MKPHSRQPAHRKQIEPKLMQAAASESKLVEIGKPIYGGAFLARAEGKAVFVPLTLPGEQARVHITQDKRGYSIAEADEIITASPQRIASACPHFGVCGGCHYQHANYETQLVFKQAILRETLERGGVRAPDEIGVLAAEAQSQSWHYRNRIRLAFDASGNHGYRGRRSNTVVPVSACPIAASLLLNAAQAAAEIMRQLAPSLRPTEIALFCDANETALLASIFIAGSTKVRFNEYAQALSERIPELKGAELVDEGYKNQPPRSLAQWGAASLSYRATNFDYRVDHGAFFQVNRYLVDALVEHVVAGHKGQLAWDLFAGVGLFARSLTRSFDRVIAVESAPAATPALAANLERTTGTSIRSTTLDFLRGSRKAQLTDSVTPDLIVVDPPRTGLGPEITMLLAGVAAPALAYVSCDPATLSRDLRMLIGLGYTIQAITLADLFPQTFHLETVVQLRRS